MITICRYIFSSKEDYKKRGKTNTSKGEKALQVLQALGGKENINNLDACITRLRVGIIDKSQVNHDQLKLLGAKGVLDVGNGIQAIFGPTSEVLKNQIIDIIDQDETA
ncbi:glucose PTS transporter subunit EIIB [Cytobacillus oceanisediminis]|uniref:glucose PTS transporter subunit EIIB n=1 Tax=Cytobacillus oceanisediminis TaxID=665099 RepID=UPI00058C9621